MPTVPATELCGAWTGITFARRILRADHLIIKGDSTAVVAWIQESMRREVVHFLFHDIIAILRDCTSILVRHVYRKANSIADWAATYIAEHSGDFMWTDMREAPSHF